MSFSHSQERLYKDKCLYIAMNVMLSKIQRLEKEVLQLKLQLSTKQSNDTLKSMNKRINKLEILQNNPIMNNEQFSNNMTSALDEYLKDIESVEDVQFNAINNNTEKIKK